MLRPLTRARLPVPSILVALMVAVMALASPATAADPSADPLTSDEVAAVADTLEQLKAEFGDRVVDPTTADAETARAILTRHGFASPDQWQARFQRTAAAFALADMPAEDRAAMKIEMEQALETLAATDIPAEHKQALAAQMQGQMATMRSIGDADITAVTPHMDRLRRIFEE